MARPGDGSRTDALIEYPDALPCYTLPEMKAVGLQGYYGVSQLGIKTIFVDSN
jgi:hypothetical protein